tara:strand:- start:4573 stop:5100 length:528 start_codon:yes stop_codon:yes gene_type:complete
MLKEDLDGKEILDIGTGSGCIAISLAKNLPNAKVTALDISKDAIEVAKENAKLNNVDIEFINADIFEYQSDKKYDIIVSNPPYVLESEKPLMKQTVFNFEPELALFIKEKFPLIIYKHVISNKYQLLKKNGLVFFEINNLMKNNLKNFLRTEKSINYVFFKDFFKKNRYCRINFN